MATKIIQKLVKASGDVFRVKEGTGAWSSLQTITPVATAGDSFDCSNYRLSKRINIKKNSGFTYREVTIFKFSAKGGYKSSSDVVTYEKLDTTWSDVGDKPAWWDATDMFSQVEIHSDAPAKNTLSSVSENACDITISSSAEYYNGNNSEIFGVESGDGHTFSTKSELQTAVDEWASDSTSATETYGDINTWNVSAITDMSQLFLAKTTITELDLSDWDVSNVTDMRQMFVAMINCTSLDISGWDTSSVTDMGVMFGNMPKLESLDVTHFDTSNVTDMSSLFANTRELTSLDVTNFDTSKVTNMANMFGGMAKLTSLDVTDFDTSKVTNMSQMFSQIPVSTLDLSSFDTSSVTSLRSFFYGCRELTSIDLAHFDTNNVTDMAYMFWDTWKLDAIQGINDFDTDNVTVMHKMFARNGVAATIAELPTSSGLTSIDLSGWNVANVVATTSGGEEGFGNMFMDLTSLTDVGDLSNWCVENVTSEPTDFATNAPFANTSSNLPVWGTCPSA